LEARQRLVGKIGADQDLLINPPWALLDHEQGDGCCSEQFVQRPTDATEGPLTTIAQDDQVAFFLFRYLLNDFMRFALEDVHRCRGDSLEVVPQQPLDTPCQFRRLSP